MFGRQYFLFYFHKSLVTVSVAVEHWKYIVLVRVHRLAERTSPKMALLIYSEIKAHGQFTWKLTLCAFANAYCTHELCCTGVRNSTNWTYFIENSFILISANSVLANVKWSHIHFQWSNVPGVVEGGGSVVVYGEQSVGAVKCKLDWWQAI